ncbi:hypothetical protein M9458_055406, partial [Cirrhinus mrigala]
GGWRLEDCVEEFLDACHWARCDEVCLMVGFCYGLDDDIRFVIPHGDPWWTLKSYINFALWMKGSAFMVDKADVEDYISIQPQRADFLKRGTEPSQPSSPLSTDSLAPCSLVSTMVRLPTGCTGLPCSYGSTLVTLLIIHCLGITLLRLHLVSPSLRLCQAPPSLRLYLHPQALRLYRVTQALCLLGFVWVSIAGVIAGTRIPGSTSQASIMAPPSSDSAVGSHPGWALFVLNSSRPPQALHPPSAMPSYSLASSSF